MADLVSWLSAQLDADAATAGAVRPDPTLQPREPIEFILAGQDITVPSTEAAERHIREFADPARVLREIEAKRQIIARYEELRAASKEQGLIGDVTEEYQDFLLRLLATVYSDRPGYQEAWRP